MYGAPTWNSSLYEGAWIIYFDSIGAFRSHEYWTWASSLMNKGSSNFYYWTIFLQYPFRTLSQRFSQAYGYIVQHCYERKNTSRRQSVSLTCVHKHVRATAQKRSISLPPGVFTILRKSTLFRLSSYDTWQYILLHSHPHRHTLSRKYVQIRLSSKSRRRFDANILKTKCSNDKRECTNSQNALMQNTHHNTIWPDKLRNSMQYFYIYTVYCIPMLYVCMCTLYYYYYYPLPI